MKIVSIFVIAIFNFFIKNILSTSDIRSNFKRIHSIAHFKTFHATSYTGAYQPGSPWPHYRGRFNNNNSFGGGDQSNKRKFDQASASMGTSKKIKFED